MKYYGKITVYRYEDNWNPEITEIYAEHFESPSIQVRQSETHKNRKWANALLLGSVLGQRNTGIHRQGSTLEALEQSARYL